MEKLKNELTQWLHSKKRMTNLLVGLGAVLLYEVARAYYRPFIYSNAINDFHLADTLGNSLGTLATVFVLVSLFGRDPTKDYFVLRAVVIGVLLYEVAQPLLGNPIDPWDLVATICAGLLSESLYRLLHERQPQMPNAKDLTS